MEKVIYDEMAARTLDRIEVKTEDEGGGGEGSEPVPSHLLRRLSANQRRKIVSDLFLQRRSCSTSFPK